MITDSMTYNSVTCAEESCLPMSGMQLKKKPLPGRLSLHRAKGTIWQYTEFMCRQGRWKRTGRTIYSRLIVRDTQLSLPGMSLDSVIITYVGLEGAIDNQLG